MQVGAHMCVKLYPQILITGTSIQADAVQGSSMLPQAQLVAPPIRNLSPRTGISILAGATLGGGTRINWQASFRTPAHVRREWATEHGLEAFNTPRYDRALDAVWQRIGVTTGTDSHTRFVV